MVRKRLCFLADVVLESYLAGLLSVMFSFFFLLFFFGCSIRSKPSVIVLAFDRLAFNSFSCADERSTSISGLSILCKESLRFTHAYTTSIQPSAAMASLLTGSYPYQHQLHRSWGRISSQQKLLSEIASEQGYRTSFFGSSPNILKKTGLSKGFDLFDDQSFLDFRNYLTPFKRQTEIALSWIKEIDDSPFLSIIYSSELAALGETATEVSTFEKFDEALAQFFNKLKQENLWHMNYVVVVGLQGRSDYSRLNETLLSNLHSENTHVSLFVKPPRQKGDDGMPWKSDTFVNLADLGWGLIKTLQAFYLKPIDDNFPILDLSLFWKDKNPGRPPEAERRLLVEAVNPWATDIESRYAILFKNLIYLEDQSDELYNSLTDGLETIDISNSATSTQNDFKNESRKLLGNIRLTTEENQWLHFKTDIDDLVSSNRDYWSNPNLRPDILISEYSRLKLGGTFQPLSALMVQNLITNGKIEQLKSLSLNFDAIKFAAEKESIFEEARRQSLNLTFENLWGLWGRSKVWNQSVLIKEYQ